MVSPCGRNAATRDALAALGLMAIDGRGMDKDPAQGKAWLEDAARKGEPAASYNLAPAAADDRDAS